MKSFSFYKAALLIVLLVGLIQAMPPRPGLELPPEDYAEMARLGINISKNPVRDIGKRGIYNTPGDVIPLVTGTKQFPVVCIKFPDYANTYVTASFDSMLFSDYWTSGSAKNYYQEISYGNFTLQGTVVGWYTSANNKAYYGYSNGFQRAAILAKEAATAADATVNYALYDNDGDGYVDCFTCVHAGFGREETGSGTDIHSHSWDFTSAGIGAYTTDDPDPNRPGQYIKINEYVMDPERSSYSNKGTMVCIGVFCHEWGHALGLPDLYDTDYSGNGLGNWCLMAGGSWGANGNSPWYPAHLSVWGKMDMGWVNPTAVRKRDLYSIPQIETNSKAYWLISRQRTFREYFLIENRRKTGFDVN
ncbi:MAG: M6 family metalloprotease domain-containing protein, partial [candidate division WOR-3 bacterium]